MEGLIEKTATSAYEWTKAFEELPIVPQATGRRITNHRQLADWLAKKDVYGEVRDVYIYASNESGIGGEIYESFFYRIGKKEWVQSGNIVSTTY